MNDAIKEINKRLEKNEIHPLYGGQNISSINNNMKYNGKEVKIIKDYGTWVLFEHPEGFKEGINKQDLGLVIKRDIEQSTPILRGVFGNRV